MNLTNLQPKLRALFKGAAIAIGILLLVYSVYAVFRVPRPSKPATKGAPNTIVPPQKEAEELPTDVKAIREKIIASQIADQAGDKILVQSENYEIAYIPTPDVFFVSIYKDQAEVFKKEAQDWFKKFGLRQEDLCDLPVRFVLENFEVRKNNPNFSSLPEGCQGEPISNP